MRMLHFVKHGVSNVITFAFKSLAADEKASSAKPTPPSRRTVYTEKPLPPGHALPQLKKGTTVARDLDDKLLPTQTTPTQLISPVKCIPRM